ncbi:mechanosensitive ion channel domain-containing protein [Acidihalobacter ferrooxydans]|uniref:Mechanosensitive ion channel protein MscS n=1 Tax=Acidihalobacter ferrooxydans TaxID=1765967 RepID=A0A1P8UIA3_9GAMM|nr:mechanosensitive ion channel domain-containing protein [Acidihalobacter ferrooxydans]APZ43573.1 hypothetical protein BW247_11130 [Acidihalobacter ferrooxydans]
MLFALARSGRADFSLSKLFAIGLILLGCALPWSAHAAGFALPGLSFAQASKPAASTSHASAAQANPSPTTTAEDYRALERMLQNPKARAALIATLQKLAAEQTGTAKTAAQTTTKTASKTAAAPSTHTLTDILLGSINALTAQSVGALNALQSLRNSLVDSPQATSHWRGIAHLAWPVAALALLMYAVLWGLRLPLRVPLGMLFNWAARGSDRSRLLRGLLMVVIQGVAGVVVIGIAWSIGGVAAAWLSGSNASLRILFAAWLHAFLLVEGLHLVVLLLLSERFSVSVLLGRGARVTRRLRAPLTRLVMLLGYGLVFIVPMTAHWVGQPLAHALIWLIGVLAYVDAVRALLARREAFTQALQAAAQRRGEGTMAWVLRVLARVWLLLAVLYITVLLGALLLRPGDVLPFIAHASVLSLVYILLALLISKFMGQWLGAALHVPASVTRRLPSLERRVNQLRPYVLASAHTVIAVVLFAALAEVWRIVNVLAWLGSPTGQLVLGRVIVAAVIAGVILVIWALVDSLVEARLQAGGDRIPSARAKTLLSLFRLVFGIVIAVIGSMMLLSALGMNIGPLLAGASVLGLAVGFGSQKLVQDIINGVFIQVENAINVGDVVTAGNITGTAEMVSIRSVRLRDVYGTYHIIPYSSVNEVSNFSHGFANCIGVYGIAYREDIDEATQKLHEAFDDLMTDEAVKDNILEPMVVHGVVALNNSSVDIRVSIKVKPGTQWGVQRAMNRLVKIHFDRAGIEIPFPQQTVWFGEGKDGKAPAAALRLESPPAASPDVSPDEPSNTNPPAPAGNA